MPEKEVKLLELRCRVKPQSPQEVGYTSLAPLKEAMEQQAALPLHERIRPCHKHKWWWVEQAPACMKCLDAIWRLDVGGAILEAEALRVSGKVTEIAIRETGEVLRYERGGRRELGRGFV